MRYKHKSRQADVQKKLQKTMMREAPINLTKPIDRIILARTALRQYPDGYILLPTDLDY